MKNVLPIRGHNVLNHQSVRAVQEAQFSGNPSWVQPLYGSYCFSRIGPTITALLRGRPDRNQLPQDCLLPCKRQAKRVISFFFDALGWCFINDFDHPVLKRFRDQGVVSKLTAQFPSTTAAHVPTLATGKPVGMTGVFEWWMFLPQVGDLVSPLLFAQREDAPQRGTLSRLGVTARDVFTARPISQDLLREGILSVVVSPQNIVGGPADQYLQQGSLRCCFDGVRDIPRALRQAKPTRPQRVTVYLPEMDTMGHKFGVGSPEFLAARNAGLDAIQECIAEFDDGQTMFMLFADHGQCVVTPQDAATNIVLDHQVPELRGMVICSASGEPLPPAGGLRDAFLHIRPEALERAYRLLTEVLRGKAQVHLTEKLIRQDRLFGPQVSEEFCRRIGNLTILPLDGHVLTWSTHARKRMEFRADHGGLTKAEMEIPFMVL